MSFPSNLAGLLVAGPSAVLLKATLVLVLALLLAVIWRGKSAGQRHLVWSAAVAATLLVPLFATRPAFRWDLAVLPAPAPLATTTGQAGPAAVAPAPEVVVLHGGSDAAVPPSPVATRSVPASWWARSSWAERLFALWLAGGALVLLRLLVGALLVARTVRRAEPLDTPEWQHPLMDVADRLGLAELPRLRLSRRLPMPFACGLFRPAIVLPGEAETWSAERRHAVLCHELAHLSRRDLAMNLLSQCALAVYWFHPLMWIAIRRLRVESERACDDLVLNTGTRASEYADHLLQILRAVSRAPMPAAVLPFAQRGEFEGRVLAILEPHARREPAGRRGAATIFALGLLLVLPLATLRLVPRATPATPEQWASGLLAPGADTSQVMRTQERTSTVERKAVKEVVSPAPASTDRPEPRPDPRPDPRVSAAVPMAPSATGSDSALVIRSLINALTDSAASVRQNAVYSLGRLGATVAATPLQGVLVRDPNAEVREMSAWALGNMRAPGSIQAVAAAIARDTSARVRATAVWAAGQLSTPELLPVLEVALRDGQKEVRLRAAWAIGTIRPEHAPAALLAAAADSQAAVRHKVAWALGQIRDPGSLPALLRLVQDSASEVRELAFWALGNQEPGPAVETALLKALEAPDPGIRAQAARALSGARGTPWPWPWPMPR